MIRKFATVTAITLAGVMAVSACSGHASTSGSLTCQVGTDSDGTPGWTATFTNDTSTDITVNSYTALFFNSAGEQTGSQDAVNTGFTVGAGSTYSDAEYHGFLLTIPANSVSCRVSNVSES